ncbi:MAG: NADH-quinone oxidoreductase subunit C [Candidatus Omnitrophica bacterium]|nr:NADH-quinone oxidoreductase subunit C [Candidatus Omnitrophota bacterium]
MIITREVKEKLKDKIISWQEHSSKRIYIGISPKDLQSVASLLFKGMGFRFITASGQEMPKGFEIIYHFSIDKTGEIISLRVKLEDKDKPEIDSLAPLIIGAEWIEREMWELLGINFKGHPNLKRLLLAEEWPEGEYPLRHEHDHEHEHSHEDGHKHEDKKRD